jgi:uroporphyrinogen-III decarboxylase
VRLHICGNITPLLAHLGACEPDLVDLDSMVPVAAARAALGPAVCLAGNINPVADLRNASPGRVFELLGACFRDAGSSAFMVAAGCEVPRDTPAECLRAVIDFARSHAPGSP